MAFACVKRFWSWGRGGGSRGGGLATVGHFLADGGALAVRDAGEGGGVGDVFFERDVGGVHGDELRGGGAVGEQGDGVAGLQGGELGTHGLPQGGHVHMLLVQGAGGVDEGGVTTGEEDREDVEFLVLMVVGACQVEVAHDVGGSLPGLGVGAVEAGVLGEAFEQGAHALHAVVAGFQHGLRVFEGGVGAAAGFGKGDGGHGELFSAEGGQVCDCAPAA